MKTITEYIINENKFIDGVKNLFQKIKQKVQGEAYFEEETNMSTKIFGELKHSLENDKQICISPMVLTDEMFEIWHVYDTKDKYGDTITGFALLGIYDGKNQTLGYKQQLKDLIDKKYFE